MNTIRTTALASLVLAAGLALSGCAAEAPASTSADSCQDLNADVRDINNAALNTLAGDVSADVTGVQARFDGLIVRAEALPSNAADAAAIGELSDALSAAIDYAPTAATPETPEAAADAEVRAGIVADIDAATTAVKDSCSAK